MYEKNIISRGEFLSFGLLYVICSIFIGIYGGFVISDYYLTDSLWRFFFLSIGLFILLVNFLLFGRKYKRLLKSLN